MGFITPFSGWFTTMYTQAVALVLAFLICRVFTDKLNYGYSYLWLLHGMYLSLTDWNAGLIFRLYILGLSFVAYMIYMTYYSKNERVYAFYVQTLSFLSCLVYYMMYIPK